MRILRNPIFASALVATLLTAGCGDDDDDAASEPTTTGAASTTAAPATTAAPSGTPSTGTPTNGTPTTAPPIEIPEITVDVAGGGDQEFVYATDLTSIPAGPVAVRLVNNGTKEHQAMLMRMNDGVDLAAFAAAAASDPTGVMALSLLEGFGGPNAVEPGASVTSTQVLVPGNYLLICFIPDGDGMPHAAKGMLRPFTVTEADAPTSLEGTADAVVSLADFAFVSPTKLPASGTIEVKNDGQQPHELTLYRVAEGTTAEEARQALLSGDPTPVSDPVGGVGTIAPGSAVRFDLDAEAGEYLLVCFLPSALHGGAPHFTQGMITTVNAA